MNPLEASAHILGSRWRAVLIYSLLNGPLRFTDLQKSVGISRRMLAVNLQVLKDAGIIFRTSYPEIPPRVEYALTPEGMELRTIIYDLYELGQKFIERQLPLDKQPEQISLL